MLDFQSPIILEFLHNFYLNVYHDVALAGGDFFEALNDDFKKPQQILDRLLNYHEHITTRIIGLLEDHTVMTLNLETFDLYHYDPYAPNDSVGREARIQNLEAMIPKIKALFEYHDKIRMVVGYIPNELLQEKVRGNEYFGCCVMELLIKYTNLPNIAGLEFENLRKRFQSWCYEVLKFKQNPQWIPFGSPLNYFETVRNVHNGGPVDISVVVRYIRQEIQLHSTNQRQIGFFDPAWLKHCDEYPIEIILEKFGQNYSSDTKKLIFLVAIEEHQYLFEYYNHKLICKNSIVSYEDNPEWKKRTDAIRSKIRPILKAIFYDRDYVRYNAKIDKNLVQHQNCPIDSPLFVVKFANLSIEDVKHEGQFNPADSRKVLKNAFSLKFIDFRIADAASSASKPVKYI
uniref:Uncharacterized protein n=1 Tax=Panagrolaimus davidi TaxID=227884 RepID=A0A914PFT0_9BILA